MYSLNMFNELMLYSSLCVLSQYIYVFGGSTTEENEEISTIIPISELRRFGTSPTADKNLLRYGFHKIQDCDNFNLAFVCVQKCIDLEYDIAHSDKECKCTCFKNKIKAKYKSTGYVTKWRLGAPTTKLPPWAQPAKLQGGLANQYISDEEIPRPADDSSVEIGFVNGTDYGGLNGTGDTGNGTGGTGNGTDLGGSGNLTAGVTGGNNTNNSTG